MRPPIVLCSSISPGLRSLYTFNARTASPELSPCSPVIRSFCVNPSPYIPPTNVVRALLEASSASRCLASISYCSISFLINPILAADSCATRSACCVFIPYPMTFSAPTSFTREAESVIPGACRRNAGSCNSFSATCCAASFCSLLAVCCFCFSN